MITREDGDNVYISVNDLADGDDREADTAHQTSLRLSRVMEQSSIRDTSREFISMKDYLIGCGYQSDTRIHRALLQILENNGVEDIMDMINREADGSESLEARISVQRLVHSRSCRGSA